jgi:phosphopantothenoylcysteine decarboxylase / phosphopantothenate---cysteine ligase
MTSSIKALVTAGPTYEEMDPVRFIGNYSTGKMGFAIADAFAQKGIEVVLVSGPSEQQVTHQAIRRIDVTSADDMFRVCEKFCHACDIVIFAAAVADYKPALRLPEKMKKVDEKIMLELEKTVDIAATLGALKTDEQVFGGFALETENGKVNAIKKLFRKNLDFIVLNSSGDEGSGFRHDTNKVTIFSRDGSIKAHPLKEKKVVARDIVSEALSIYYEKETMTGISPAG